MRLREERGRMEEEEEEEGGGREDGGRCRRIFWGF